MTKIGFSTATDQDLFRLTKDFESWQKTVVLTMDEMYICEGVVYDKHTGHMLGFTDLGDINNHLQRYKELLIITLKNAAIIHLFTMYRLENMAFKDGAGTVRVSSVAKTMLVFLVRGLTSSLQYPYVQFACRYVKASDMYRPVTEAIHRLEKIGLKV